MKILALKRAYRLVGRYLSFDKIVALKRADCFYWEWWLGSFWAGWCGGGLGGGVGRGGGWGGGGAAGAGGGGGGGGLGVDLSTTLRAALLLAQQRLGVHGVCAGLSNTLMRVPHDQMARAGREAGRAGGGVDALLPLRFGVEVCFGLFSALLLASATEDVEPPPFFALAGKTGAGRQAVDLCAHGGWQAVNPGLDEGLGGGWRR